MARGIPADDFWARVDRAAERAQDRIRRRGDERPLGDRLAEVAQVQEARRLVDEIADEPAPEDRTDRELYAELEEELAQAAEAIRQRPRYAQLGLTTVRSGEVVDRRTGNQIGGRVWVFRDESPKEGQ